MKYSSGVEVEYATEELNGHIASYFLFPDSRRYIKDLVEVEIYADLNGKETLLFELEMQVNDPCQISSFTPNRIENDKDDGKFRNDAEDTFDTTIPMPDDTTSLTYEIEECRKELYCLDKNN